MKKILLTIFMLATAAISQAQFVISAQLGGATTSGAITPTPSQYLGFSPLTGADTTFFYPNDTLTYPRTMDFTGGIKFGYQSGRIQAGLAASFSWGTAKGDLSAKDYADLYRNNPYAVIKDNYISQMSDYTGWYRENHWSLAIAPYLRYEAITLGDVAFFIELNGYYRRTFQPKRHEYVDFSRMEMRNTVDTTFRITDSSTALGVQLVPGLSWQLTPHCYIDLYFDLLAFGYDKTTANNITVKEDWDLITYPYVIARRETISTSTTITTIGFQTLGTPALSSAHQNWVRVGINYTF
ncbi:MAG: hypothetical protein MJZ99_10640 [Bacteroidales bacterium]|nr:hypothetical protein [Bacteroidales bacterium]